MAVTCEPCKKTFKTDESLQRHVQDSPRHKHNQYCEVCDRYFNRVDSLQQHLQESKAHKNVAAAAAAAEANTTNNTPLDEFFLSFQTFEYDPTLSPAKSYSLLRRHMAWSRESPEGKEAWERYREALVDEVRVWFGNENDIAAWNTLCRAIGVQQPPETIDACVGVIRNTHVNIVDLIEWGRGGGGEETVEVFSSMGALREYTITSQKYFPLDAVVNERGETNIVLRHLLRKFFPKQGGRARFLV